MPSSPSSKPTDGCTNTKQAANHNFFSGGWPQESLGNPARPAPPGSADLAACGRPAGPTQPSKVETPGGPESSALYDSSR
ncbi:hypothetical protein THAOC_09142 [Thalassiosira oceanica]|uniref:Uncharacterized protein n=1 Tax=Thalassiosira oceanica TaxID=159749 RepID=K0SVX9_THAOC|nr:hypothetical protein THAOC_09142 [Thalassiosira oceanica]|eukprot:EJK69585.1 hypothetical protein THAOC_09142 [Thalassiosira oceanica]